MHKIILDTDPGIDDAMTLFSALAHPDIELLGVTTVFGNVSVQQATHNALGLLSLAGASHIRVASGVEHPIQHALMPWPDFVHGRDGLGHVALPASTSTALSIDAADFIIQQAKMMPDEVTLVAIGSLGNLALALQREPQLTQWVKQVVLMGGCIATDGNVSPAAEANIFSDPYAADQVMAANWDVTMIGLDVTHQIVLPRSLFAEIAAQNPKVGAFMQQAVQFYSDFYARVRGIDGCYGHDISALAYVVQPALFQCIHGSICVATQGVARGQTIMDQHDLSSYFVKDWEQRPKQHAAMQVNAEGVIALFKQVMCHESWSLV